MSLKILMKRFMGILLLMLVTSFCFAAEDKLIGNWETRDSKSHAATSVIKIWKSGGKYFGKVVKVYLVNGAKTTDVCDKCRGAQHNKPMLGLMIIKNVHAKGITYEGGTILDPRDGKEYHVILTPSADGRTLAVRGYIGVPLLGRTDTWYRVK